MAPEAVGSGALRRLMPGEPLFIGNDKLQVRLAPDAGGRISKMSFEGVEWLCGFDADNAAAIAWGCYPLVPWAGRLRRGRFRFDGREYQLPPNLGAHAIHGVGFTQRWQVGARSPTQLEMSLQLPRDASWPFGGTALQRLTVNGRILRLELSVTAGKYAMPKPVLGWHPWFQKPTRLDFAPTRCYPRDREGIATLPLVKPPPGPWDDCFINTRAVVLHRGQQSLRLSSECEHWVVFDQRPHATCVEPQTGPPDAFNLLPKERLEAGETVEAWLLLEWLGEAEPAVSAATPRRRG
jgi:aldose 1-epimerase